LWPLSIAKLMVSDPVSDGFVASLAKPGGNITGFTIFEHSFAGKWLEMLKEAAPAMTRVAVMQNPDHPAWTAYLRVINEVARTFCARAQRRPRPTVEQSRRQPSRRDRGGRDAPPSALDLFAAGLSDK
jgi:hypothetical protein